MASAFNELVAKHIDRYSARLSAGIRGRTFMGATVNVQECARYLSLWLGILAKDGKNLTPEEHAELNDALGDEGA